MQSLWQVCVHGTRAFFAAAETNFWTPLRYGPNFTPMHSGLGSCSLGVHWFYHSRLPLFPALRSLPLHPNFPARFLVPRFPGLPLALFGVVVVVRQAGLFARVSVGGLPESKVVLSE